jgi:hypothetical protein
MFDLKRLMQLTNTPNSPCSKQSRRIYTTSGSGPRLFALEGGGVPSLSALMTLQQLMETVNLDARPKPFDISI